MISTRIAQSSGWSARSKAGYAVDGRGRPRRVGAATGVGVLGHGTFGSGRIVLGGATVEARTAACCGKLISIGGRLAIREELS